MNRPAVTIEQDKLVTDAVNLMLKKQVKRLPVDDAGGKLVGMLSRVDVFHTILRECPDWRAFQKQQVTVNLRLRVRHHASGHLDSSSRYPDRGGDSSHRLQ